MVVTCLPRTSNANVIQLATTSPSTHTVQAEQAPRSQPILVPVRPRLSRKTSANIVPGSTRTGSVRPLTDKESATAPGPSTCGGLMRSPAAAGTPKPPSRSATLAAESPAPLKNVRRDISTRRAPPSPLRSVCGSTILCPPLMSCVCLSVLLMHALIQATGSRSSQLYLKLATGGPRPSSHDVE